MTAAGSHYFDEEPTTESSPREVQLSLPDMHLALTTDRGVFGYDRVDSGTKLLLLHAPIPNATGNLLDIGCGTGAIALTMARRSPAATVWAIDVNERARDLCRDNAQRNGIANITVCAPDEVPADIMFDTIWSNPAIRIGKPALHAMLLRWLGQLSPDGSAVLVVHKHLGSDSLQTWLGTQGYHTTRLASAAGYRILEVGPAK
ncbi:MAG: class I SAM-dependent methyltransferase [Ilumatobacteraceae bacterium]|nr:class I SAM-dependent methyltransferase [Ilumatobacteraceae bacterium]